MPIRIQPCTKDRCRYDIVSDSCNDMTLGHAVVRTGRDKKKFLAVTLDAPKLPQPIHCRLQHRAEDAVLLWERDQLLEQITHMLQRCSLDGWKLEPDVNCVLQQIERLCEESGLDLDWNLQAMRGTSNRDDIEF